jgi:sugar lactone lactonase YvrE
MSPNSAPAGSNAVTLTITGSGFLSTSEVMVGSTLESTTYVSATQLTATVLASQLTSGAEMPVVVLNGGLSSGSGTTTNFEVNNPVPTIASLSPTIALAGTASAVVTVTGTGFVPTTVINVNGSARATTYINATQVSAALPTSDFATAGTLVLTAVNSAPSGGTSTAMSLTVNNPPVGAIQLNPSSLPSRASTAATVTITGSGFVPASVAQVNGTARATTYVSGTTLTFVATVADQATAANLLVTVVNPAPGGGTSFPATLSIVAPPATPVITLVSPTSFIAGSPSSGLSVVGTGFVSTSVVQWNGVNLPTTFSNYFGSSELSATVPASDLATVGTASITVDTPGATPPVSNAVSISITNAPVPTLTSISPNAGPINTPSALTLTGTGFTTATTVAVNGATISSTFVNSTQITANLSASNLATPGNDNITVTTPAPGGGTSAVQIYTAYISTPNNDIVYNPADGLLYASVPASTVGAPGNAVVGIDPLTGNVTRQIQVGTTPNKLALSTDGTQLFVGIDGAGAVAQVNLTTGTVVNQFSLGGGPGIYNAPYTAAYLAAVPGSPNSVAVATTGYISGSGVTIFDSGVARTANTQSYGEGPLSFGSSASPLYLAASNLEALSVNSTGIGAATQLASSIGQVSTLQYDNGQLYLSSATVVNASTGALTGTFYTSGNTPANGPVVSDSTLGRAFIGIAPFSSTAAVYVFDESSFNLLGTIPLNGVGVASYPTDFRKIVRWGQNGLAVAAVPSAFTTSNQIYIVQSSLVKDISSTPADLSVSLAAPATATTGTSINWVAKVRNAGPNSAAGATLALSLDSSLIIHSIVASQGSCGTGTAFTCDLGSLASGASATVTVSATPTDAGTLAGTADATSASYDPALANNQSTSSTIVTGALYGAVPSISGISPNLVQAGSAECTLTVNGAGFNASSTVNLGTTALTTTFVSATQLTATVTAAEIATYGWAPIQVANPAPGGGVSAITPLTIYDVVNVPANDILFDPYAQFLYATIPSTSTSLTGDSVVSINPYTGVVGTPVPVGSQPTAMAETADGNDLYISLSGSNTVAQYSLLHQTLSQTLSFSGAPANSAATALAVMPGTDTTLAVDFSGSDGIMDISGSVGTFRHSFANASFPTFGSASELYTYDNFSTGEEFYRYSINAGGLTLIDGTTLDGMGGFSGGFQLVDGLVYGAGGGIANPSTTPPSQIASLPLADFYGSGDIGPGVASSPDPSLQKDFLMLENDAGTWAYGLTRYDLKTYLPEAVLGMPAPASGVDANWTMLRFGQDGLALLSYDNIGISPAVSELILLRGPFIAPLELGTNTAASLSSSSATTVAHGSGNTMLTLTGSNFLPGVAVTWNGAYRTTTIVDATHVTVAIPASDLASAGTAALVATNPGAAASSALHVTIN